MNPSPGGDASTPSAPVGAALILVRRRESSYPHALSSEAPENAALAGLLATIADRKIRRKIQKLLQLGEEAVRALGELDIALYLREDGEEQLQIVADAVLSHFRRLLAYLSMVAPTAAGSADAGDMELELDGAPAPRKSGPIAVRGVIAHREYSDDERWTALSGEMGTLQYGLESELKEFDRRFSNALKNDRKEQAVRDLNDATTGLMDGVFAVMTTVYECFLGHAEPERMVPGHRDTLGKALAVRRLLAELRREVRELNAPVQDRATAPDVAETCYRRIVEVVVRFLESDVFNYLRSDTRRDFRQFRDTLASGNAVKNRLDAEGFDKYLDSLSFVSQRGVLIKHDTDLKTKITADLDKALRYVAVLPDVTCEVIEQAFVKGERLLGLNDPIDALVVQYAGLSAEQRADVMHAVPLGRQLVELVRPPPAPAAPSGNDIF